MQDAATQFAHPMLVPMSAEDESRQDFVRALKYHLAAKVAPGNRAAFDRRAAPAFARQAGHAPRNYNEIRQAMTDDPYFRFWSALQRNSQEMMWRSVQLPVERSLDTLIETGEALKGTVGSLQLDPDLNVPAYHQLVDIHCMPGGYHGEHATNDVANGAVYDRAVWLYAMGRMGPFNSDIGDTTIDYLRAHYPDLKPRRILDMGCTVGHSTLPYVDAYPDAEVHGIDIGAPVLRYAHARASALGKPVHFSQQNAESTSFEDGSFDLIVSHILVHETSHRAIRTIMREAHRLLAPGGVVIHAETPPYAALDPFDAFMLDWDTRNNNEPFWGASHEIDPKAIAAETGFDLELAFEAMQPSAYDAAEAKRTRVFQGGDFGGGGAWYLWGARKGTAGA